MHSLVHVCLTPDYDQQAQQAEALIRGLAAHQIKQLLICRPNSTLQHQLGDLANLQLITVKHIFAGHRLVAANSLVHAHDASAAKWARIQELWRRTPWLLSWYHAEAASVDNLSKRLLKHARVVLVTSAPVEQLLRSLAYSAVKLIYPSIIKPKSNPVQVTQLRSYYQGRFVVGHIGFFSEAGNQSLLLAAAQKLASKLPNLVFVILGDGPNFEELSAASQGLTNVHLVRRTDNLDAYLSIMNVFVEPAQTSGELKNLLLAMHFHIPVLASKISGFTRLIQHRSNGLLFSNNNLDALIKMLELSYSSPALRTNLSRQAHHLVKATSAEQVSYELIKVYRLLLQSLKAQDE